MPACPGRGAAQMISASPAIPGEAFFTFRSRKRINQEGGLAANVRQFVRHRKGEQGAPSVAFALPDEGRKLKGALLSGVRGAAGLEGAVNFNAFRLPVFFITGDQAVGDHGQGPLVRAYFVPAGGIHDERGKPLDFRQRTGLILKKAHARMIASGVGLPRKKAAAPPWSMPAEPFVLPAS